MMRVLICGPKLAACGIVLSTWGVIMLVSLTFCCLFFCILGYMISVNIQVIFKFKKALKPCPEKTDSSPVAMLGIFFTTHSAVLIEDVPVTDEDIHEDKNPPQRIYELYNKVGYNCFIAAGIYVLFAAFSCCQMRLNKQREYLVH